MWRKDDRFTSLSTINLICLPDALFFWFCACARVRALVRSTDVQKADPEGEACWMEMEGWRDLRDGGRGWRRGGVGRGGAAGEAEVNGINWLSCCWWSVRTSRIARLGLLFHCSFLAGYWQNLQTFPDSNAALLLLLLLRQLVASQTGSDVAVLVVPTGGTYLKSFCTSFIFRLILLFN